MGCRNFQSRWMHFKCRQWHKRTSPQYNQRLTPPLASGRAYSHKCSQTWLHCNAAIVHSSHPSPVRIPSMRHTFRSHCPVHQVMMFTIAHGSSHSSKCSPWSSSCCISLSFIQRPQDALEPSVVHPM